MGGRSKWCNERVSTLFSLELGVSAATFKKKAYTDFANFADACAKYPKIKLYRGTPGASSGFEGCYEFN